jgi:hypothetical protein
VREEVSNSGAFAGSRYPTPEQSRAEFLREISKLRAPAEKYQAESYARAVCLESGTCKAIMSNQSNQSNKTVDVARPRVLYFDDADASRSAFVRLFRRDDLSIPRVENFSGDNLKMSEGGGDLRWTAFRAGWQAAREHYNKETL